MVNVSQNTDISDVGSVFLKLNHLINAIEHHGYLYPVTKKLNANYKWYKV